MKKSLYHKIVSYLLTVVVMGILIFAITIGYSARVTYLQMKQNYQNSLEVLSGEVDRELGNVATYMQSFLGTTYAQEFCNLPGEAFFAEQRIRETLYNTLLLEKYVSGIWIYSDTTDREQWHRNADRSTYEEGSAIREYYSSRTNLREEDHNRWRMVTLEGKEYLVYFYMQGEVCCGAWCRVPDLLTEAENLIEEGDFSASVESGAFVRSAWGSLTISSPFVQVEGLSLVLTGEAQFLRAFNLPLALLAGFSVLCMALMAILLKNMRLYLLRPIRELSEVIQCIAGGDLDRRVDTENYVVELGEIGAHLNEMAGRIKDLKIEVYEEQLMKKDALMQFRNAQIRPHFMLNVINTIYSMASVGEDSVIMKMCRYLSDYMRYVFSSKEMVCTLSEEIKHLQEYILIQEMRYPGSIECELEIDPVILSCRIPTMAIHTLVENTFKYGMGGNERLRVTIGGALSGNRVVITITDNGPGFPEDIRRRLADGRYEREEAQGEGVGIRNCILRFRELYGEAFQFEIANQPETTVRVTVPMEI
ncbi:MAG: histidine kinase [Eubacteriales bacterium]|nr:histidine kinase [Eubacteriales bacterium]